MAEYLTGDSLVPYITDTDLSKYAVLSTETDTVLLRYADKWALLVSDAEIYLDSLIARRNLDAYTQLSDVTAPVFRLLGSYLSYKIAFDRIANNPQQNLTDLQYDLYKSKLSELKEWWKTLENSLTNYEITGNEEDIESSIDVIDLFRR